MTVIAYRDGVMAADTLMLIGGIKQHVRKVLKRRGYLLGVSGSNCPSDAEMLAWFFQEPGSLSKPNLPRTKFDMLVVTPDGGIQLWNGGGSFEPILTPFYAVGCGAEVALGAMEMGATAVQAARAAIRWSAGVEGRVTFRTLAPAASSAASRRARRK
jgi:ATP-dependent HslUV protease subunit HslV